MYRGLASVVLKSGERVEAGVIVGPDPDWSDGIEELLGHKGSAWCWGNEMSLRHELGIDALYYPQPIANASLVSYGDARASALAGKNIDFYPIMFNNFITKAKDIASAARYKQTADAAKETLAMLKREHAAGGTDAWAGKKIKILEREPPAKRWIIGNELDEVNGAYSVTIHEYGHIAHYNGGNRLAKRRIKTVKDATGADPMNDDTAWGMMGYGYNRLGGVAGRAGRDPSIKNLVDGKLSAKGKRTARGSLSDYSAKNTHEVFAEAWTAYHTGQANIIPAEILEVVKEVAEEVRTTP